LAASRGGIERLVALLSSPILQNLTHLDLANANIDEVLVYTTIATSPYLSNLVSLDLSGNQITAEGIAALAASTTLTNLTRLNVSHNPLDNQLVAQLFSPPSVLGKKLQSINLGSANITVSALQVLLQASPHLSELVLDGNHQLGPAGAALVATNMPNLVKLNLSGCSIENEGYTTLATSTTLPNLCELSLLANRVDDRFIIALINSPLMTNLLELDLGHAFHSPAVLIAIAQSAALAKLQRLKFFGNDAGDDGAIALSRSTTLTNLTWLDLGYNDIGPKGIDALCTSPVVSKLTFLRLHGNRRIDNPIAQTFTAPTSTLYSLLELDLDDVGLNDQGVLQLLASSNLDQLNVLDIRRNSASNSTKAAYQARFDGDIGY
jgi:hypothetical protein